MKKVKLHITQHKRFVPYGTPPKFSLRKNFFYAENGKRKKGFRYKVGDLRDFLEGKKIKFQKAEEYINIEEEYRVFM